MLTLLRRFPISSYFALAIAVSWIGVLIAIGGGTIPAPPAEAKARFTWVYLAMLLGPPVAGLVMTAVTGGAQALRAYRARLLEWRVAPRWYAIALLTAPVTLAATLLILLQVSDAFVPQLLRSGTVDPGGPLPAETAASFIIAGLAVGLGAGFFEELGWTGFATPALHGRYGIVRTGIVIGLVWGTWHFLAILWGSADSFGSTPIPLFMTVALFSFLPPYRVLMTWLYDRTGSLFVGILMHASLTSSMFLLGPAINGAALLAYDMVFAAVLWIAVLGVMSLRPAGRLRGAWHPTMAGDAR
jgi:membrane protease YdiL (CAAX protease family)